MESILVKKVSSRKDLDEFIRFPLELYRDCPQYVPDMEYDVRNSFNTEKNHGLSLYGAYMRNNVICESLLTKSLFELYTL